MGKYTDDEICNAAKITIKIAADYLSISPNIATGQNKCTGVWRYFD